ncbi:hypothetical protein PV10_04420 [Exophiala mesophila]|uniref:Mitochondrial thiamine pyrophosphate carrier 1 n=1 Tax=Exophiala mesophila TaxID=212818 RepID=A0A0D2A287_EXOME|nr:uncharacterized protein PV10_04420 [Exophiala mesophila]KIV93183.1 hypothetical protein PV10_04420 [Exophiala mesophila]
MANGYSSQLDSFERYHQAQERQSTPPKTNTPLLEALGHGIAGSTGAVISNALLYPVDLIITRLQIQRQLRKDKSTPSDDEYHSFLDGVSKIYHNEGGIAALYTGLWQDTSKTVADSFLFFLSYSFLRDHRLSQRHAGAKGLPPLEELGVGFIAGALTKLATTPIANIVTRKQAAALLAAKEEGDTFEVPSTRDIARDIHTEKGVLGFWSGYSASLILTLNPSITFFLFETLKRLTVPRSRRDHPPASVTFLLSASSKAIASSITYPFSLAKARLQAGAKREGQDEKEAVESEIQGDKKREVVRATLFSTMLAIIQNEGPSALYQGLQVEALRAFFSHGLTMSVKQVVQRFLVKAYYVLSILLSRYQRKLGTGGKRMKERAKTSVEYYNLALARVGERVEKASESIKQKANETAEFVAEYVEEDGVVGSNTEWRDLYGTTGLARWLDGDRTGE